MSKILSQSITFDIQKLVRDSVTKKTPLLTDENVQMLEEVIGEALDQMNLLAEVSNITNPEFVDIPVTMSREKD